jgi:hypothetical protein
MIKELYKVVSPRLCSALDTMLPPKFRVKYKVGEWVKAPVGHLFTYSNERDAVNWRNFMVSEHGKPARVYRCFGKVIDDSTTRRIAWVGWNNVMSEDLIVSVWGGSAPQYDSGWAPIDTVFCSEIMLVKKIC